MDTQRADGSITGIAAGGLTGDQQARSPIGIVLMLAPLIFRIGVFGLLIYVAAVFALVAANLDNAAIIATLAAIPALAALAWHYRIREPNPKRN